MDASWSNTTFATYLCGNLSAQNQSGLSIGSAASTGPHFLFPSCAYAYLGTISTLTIYNTVFQGNTTYPDPIVRLGRAFNQIAPTLGAVSLIRSIFLTPSLTPSGIDWTSVWASLPNTAALSFSHSKFGEIGLPSTIPNRFVSLILLNTGLSGSIPATIFNASSTVAYLDASQNQLSGTIPATLFSTWTPSVARGLTLWLANNGLTGTLPSLLDGVYSQLNLINLDLRSNDFSGNIANLLASATFPDSALNTASIKLSDNRLTGSVPAWFAGAGANILSLTLDFSQNGLTGLIPSNYLTSKGFTQPLSTLILNLAGNQLDGPVPPEFLQISSDPSYSSMRFADIDFSSNMLSGTLSTDFFAKLNWTIATSFTLNLSGNQLSGSFPASLVNRSPTPYLSMLDLDLSNNGFNGSLPSSFFGSFNPSLSYSSVYVTTAIIDLSHNDFQGALALPDLSARLSAQQLTLTLSITSAGLETFSLNANVTRYLRNLDLTNNTKLGGAIPTLLIDSTARLATLKLGGTAISGTMPVVTSSVLSSLVMDGVSMDFCANTGTIWSPSSLGLCSLVATTAYYCEDQYPSGCSFSAPSPTYITNAACPEGTRPSPAFVCVGGTWTTNSTVDTPTFTVPSGNTQTVIQGSLTSSQVVIQGLGSTIIIYGCTTNLSAITVELTPADLEKIGSAGMTQLLLTLGSSNRSCSSNVSQVAITTQVVGKSCRKVSVDKLASDVSLSGVFRVDASSCNLWWIILVSVLCAVVLIAVVVVVVVVVYLQRSKARQASIRLKSASDSDGVTTK